MKMRTKEEILAGMDDNIERRKLGVEIDKRDLLNLLVYPKYKLTPEGKIERVEEE